MTGRIKHENGILDLCAVGEDNDQCSPVYLTGQNLTSSASPAGRRVSPSHTLAQPRLLSLFQRRSRRYGVLDGHSHGLVEGDLLGGGPP